MEKDTHLVNIYLKIYHKKMLTMDDLAYLARYDPECFEKTCRNVVYNVPEAKPVMAPDTTMPKAVPPVTNTPAPEPPEWMSIEKVLANLKRLEADNFPLADVDADHVKNLLGSLYMELLFPHNDKYTFVTMGEGDTPSFDRKA